MSAGRARLLETAGAPLRAPALQQARADGPRDLHEEALQEGPKRPKSFFLSLLKDFRVASLTQAFKEVLIKEELQTQLVKMVVTAALNEKKQAAFKKETLLVRDR